MNELRLTPREKQIAHMVARGASNKRIALELEISESTVKVHLASIRLKCEQRDWPADDGMPGRVRLALCLYHRGFAE